MLVSNKALMLSTSGDKKWQSGRLIKTQKEKFEESKKNEKEKKKSSRGARVHTLPANRAKSFTRKNTLFLMSLSLFRGAFFFFFLFRGACSQEQIT